MTGTQKAVALHVGVIALLFALQFALPAYHHTNFARIMVFAVYALGYNVLLGYTGLMSLGHAMFLAAGMYGAGLTMYYFGVGTPLGFLIGVLSGFLLSLLFGLLALRASGVAFLIVSMMVAQALYLCTLYFNEITLGDQGFILKVPEIWGVGVHEPVVKYNVALLLFAVTLLGGLALRLSPVGRVLVAIRENEQVAASYGIPVSLGNTPFELGVHLAVALPEVEWMEYSFQDYDALVEEPIVFEHGSALAPVRPGHGLTLSETARKEFARPSVE